MKSVFNYSRSKKSKSAFLDSEGVNLIRKFAIIKQKRAHLSITKIIFPKGKGFSVRF